MPISLWHPAPNLYTSVVDFVKFCRLVEEALSSQSWHCVADANGDKLALAVIMMIRLQYHTHLFLIVEIYIVQVKWYFDIREWSLIIGRGPTKPEGWQVKFYPHEKGVRKRFQPC